MASAGWMLAVRPAAHPDGTAGDHGRGQERHGIGQIGFDDPVPRGDWARARRASGWPAVVDVDARIAQHRHRHRDVRRRRHRLAGVHDREPVGERAHRTAADRRRTATTRRRRSRRCRRPRDPAPRTANGRPSPSMSTPRPRSASSSGAIGRARACSSPSNTHGLGAQRRDRRDEAQHGAGQAAVDPGAGCGAMGPLTVNSVRAPSTVDAERAQRADHQVGVAAAQRAADGRRPFGVASAASTSARLVSDLEPGTVTVACTGVGVDGACQLLTASILPCPIRLPPWDICVGDSR